MVNHRVQAVEKIARATIVPTKEDAERLANEADEHLDAMIMEAVQRAVDIHRPEPKMRADLWWNGYDYALRDIVYAVSFKLKADRAAVVKLMEAKKV